MIEVYNKQTATSQKAIGMADITYESTFDFIWACFKMKGTAIVKEKEKFEDFTPIQLNYL